MTQGLLLPLLASVLAFAAVLLAGLAVVGARREAGRLGWLRARIDGASGRTLDAPAPAGLAQSLAKLRGVFSTLGQRLGPTKAEDKDQTRQDFMHAGLRGPNAAQIFHGAKAALAVLPPLLLLCVVAFLPKPPALQTTVIAALFLALLGCYLPNWWLRGKIAERRNALLCELPDALDLLVVCVESGMGLDQAIHRVSEELSGSAPAICGELRVMTLEMRAGRQRQQALKDLAERTGLEDVQSLVTLLVQADLFGISVARTLRVYSETLRTGRFQRAEETAAKLPTKLMFPLICCIFPALFVVIMGPAGLQLMQVFARMGQ